MLDTSVAEGFQGWPGLQDEDIIHRGQHNSGDVIGDVCLGQDQLVSLHQMRLGDRRCGRGCKTWTSGTTRGYPW